MRSRLVVLLLSSVVLVACDAKKKSVDAGVDSGADAAIVVTPTTMCIETYAALDRATLASLTTAGVGACANDPDLDSACVGLLESTAGTCGTSCYFNNPNDSVAFSSCTTACLQQMARIPPSDACTSCFTQSVACVTQYCLLDCIAGPMAPACVMCQTMAGCRASFYTCSGLPPEPSSADAGVTDAGGDAAVDAGVVATTDASVDAGVDAGGDAAIDASVDAGDAAAIDASVDAAVVD